MCPGWGFWGAGISVLIQANLRARQAGSALVIVSGGNRQVERALTVTAAQHFLHLHPGPLSAALSCDDRSAPP